MTKHAVTAVPNDDDGPEDNESLERPTCPDCGSTQLAEHDGQAELLCQECGLVVEQSRIDDSNGPRAFSAEERERKARSGAPITYTKHDRGISTEIGSGAGELHKVAGKKRGQYHRLRKWHNRITGSKNRNLGYAFSELQSIVSTLGLPKSVHEEVARLYEKAVDQNVVQGRRTEHILAALVYIVARNQGVPRTLDEIADEWHIEKRDLGKAYRYAAQELDLRIRPPEPEAYLPRFASELELPGDVQADARDIIAASREEDLLSGKGPTGIAAAALYLAATQQGREITQKEIAARVGVTEVTVRQRYQEFVEHLSFGDSDE